MKKSRLLGVVCACLVAVFTNANAATVTIVNGSLAESANAQTGVGIHTTLDASFDVNNGPLTFSGILDPSPTSGINPGAYNLGMTVGNAYFLLHPFFPNGAFRYDSVNLTTSLVTPGAFTSNISMGYTPNDTPLDFLVVLTSGGVGLIDFAVTINQGINSFNLSASLSESVFGSGGQVSSFGVFHNGAGAGFGALGYSDVMAQTAVVPIPAAVWLFGSGLIGLIGMARRKKAA